MMAFVDPIAIPSNRAQGAHARSCMAPDRLVNGTPWRWPLPTTTDGRSPLVLAEDANARHAIDLGYPPRADRCLEIGFVFAAQSGTVALVHAGDTLDGCAIIIEHGARWMSSYSGLADARVTQGQTVRAGELIGASTRQPPRVRFELCAWREHDFESVDPLKQFARWGVPELERRRSPRTSARP